MNMKLMTISEVTKTFNVTTRMLRYYDEIGLLISIRKEDYAYRVYDEAAVRRLQQIITLRKLRIPLKKIALILENTEQIKIVQVFQDSLKEINDEISALQVIRDILYKFITQLNSTANTHINLDVLNDTLIMSVIQMLSISKINFKEERSMDELNKASEKLNKLTDKDVRIVYLPPATVASIRRIGGEPEAETGDLLFAFIKENNLPEMKPDFRHYGFNHPNGSLPDGSDHGYERWVTIPDDMEISAPFVKKQFSGGLYGGHMIPMGAFEEWSWLYEWANNHEQYEIAWGALECMHGLMEEHLNAPQHYLWSHEECDCRLQLDLLIPIKERVK